MTKDKKLPERSLEAPPSEHSKLGQQIGITERIDTNIALLQSMTASDLLTIERFTVGRYSNTKVALIYAFGIAPDAQIGVIRAQIEDMHDYLFLPHIHGIEAKLRPRGTMIYSTSKPSERFDETITDIMQGKIVILADFSPFALIMPITFFEQFQSPDDYYSDYGKYSYRLIRMACFLLAMILPAIYVSLAANHPPWLPEKIFNAGELIRTFPEQLLILTLWRLAVDSGARIHTQLAVMLTVIVSFAISDNLIATKIVNADGIVVVAISIFFAFVSLSEPLKPLLTFGRYTTLIAAWLWGIPGILLTCAALFFYGCFLRPYGTTFMYPLVPFNWRGFKDTIYRASIKTLWRKR